MVRDRYSGSPEVRGLSEVTITVIIAQNEIM